jgi:hypothetical protein
LAELTPQEWFQRLAAMFNAPTRPEWSDKLPRPTTYANAFGSAGGRTHSSRHHTPRNRYLDTLWSYNVGDAPLAQLDPEYHDVFQDVMRKARCNYAQMCIAAMRDRLELQAVSTLDDNDTNGDDMAAAIIDDNGFHAVSKEVWDYVFAMGEAYAMAVPGIDGDAQLANGNPTPAVHAIDPRRCIGIPDSHNPVRLRAALVYDRDPVTWDWTANLFLPGQKWTIPYNATMNSWSDQDVQFEPVTGLDAFGGIPIVRFDNLHGLGEYEPHVDLLDRINDVTLQRIIGFWYQALRQRALVGDEDEDDDEDSPDAAAPIDYNTLFKAGPGAMWRIPKDFSIWESQQADFSAIINGKRDDVKEFAAVTSTPLHLITPDAADGSAEGAGLMRESLTSKCRDRRARFTPPLKLLWRILFAMAGEPDRGRRMRLHWGPIEFRALAEMASASAQSQGTLSLEQRCQRIWEMSPQETDDNITQLAAESLLVAQTTQTQPDAAASTPAPQPPSENVSTDQSA